MNIYLLERWKYFSNLFSPHGEDELIWVYCKINIMCNAWRKAIVIYLCALFCFVGFHIARLTLWFISDSFSVFQTLSLPGTQELLTFNPMWTPLPEDELSSRLFALCLPCVRCSVVSSWRNPPVCVRAPVGIQHAGRQTERQHEGGGGGSAAVRHTAESAGGRLRIWSGTLSGSLHPLR